MLHHECEATLLSHLLSACSRRGETSQTKETGITLCLVEVAKHRHQRTHGATVDEIGKNRCILGQRFHGHQSLSRRILLHLTDEGRDHRTGVLDRSGACRTPEGRDTTFHEGGGPRDLLLVQNLGLFDDVDKSSDASHFVDGIAEVATHHEEAQLVHILVQLFNRGLLAALEILRGVLDPLDHLNHVGVGHHRREARRARLDHRFVCRLGFEEGKDGLDSAKLRSDLTALFRLRSSLEHGEYGRHCLAHSGVFRFSVDLKQRYQLAAAPLRDVKASLLPTRQAHGSQHVDARSNDLLVVLVSAQVGRNRVDGTAAPDHGRHALDLRQAVQESNGCPHRLLFLRVFAQHDGAVVDELSGDIFTAQALNARAFDDRVNA
mmetsp:Transcript_59238/g.163571  ORF Transcript_59238/g.163571 Transcript_59238/m.163571 type:complete len:377 (+) Transcript_59238:229-1359(+)